MVGLIEIADRPAVGNLLALAEVQQVDHGAAAGVAGQLRQVVHLAPIDLALVREKQQIGVRAGDEQVLDRVFLFGLGAGQALAAAALGPVDRGRRPLDVAVAADRDDHRLFGDQVLHVDFADFVAADFGAAGVAVLPLQLAEVLADHVQDVLPVGEDAAILGDLLEQRAAAQGVAQRPAQFGILDLQGTESFMAAWQAFFAVAWHGVGRHGDDIGGFSAFGFVRAGESAGFFYPFAAFGNPSK